MPQHQHLLAALLEDIHVDRFQRHEVVDVYRSLLSETSGAADGLRHGRLVVVLGLCEEGVQEDNVVGALEVSGLIVYV